MPDEPEPPIIQAPWDHVPEDFESAFVSPSRSKKPEDSPGFPLNAFGVLALAFVLCYVVIWASVGWYVFWTSGGGWLWGIVGFLVFAVIGALIVPIVVVVVGGSLYYSFILGIALLLFIFADSLPVPAWARWVRTALRGAIITGCVVCVFLNVPTMLAAPTFKEWKETALLGIFLPVCVIFNLYLDRIEKLTRTRTNADESS